MVGATCVAAVCAVGCTAWTVAEAEVDEGGVDGLLTLEQAATAIPPNTLTASAKEVRLFIPAQRVQSLHHAAGAERVGFEPTKVF